MIKQVATRFLQHLTNQNNWSRQQLMGYAGKVVAFDFTLIKANLIILEDGSLAISGESFSNQSAAPDATIYLPPSLALRLLANDEAAKMQIKIEGDAHLATEFSKVLQNMRWDVEEDLSHVVGDIAASKIGAASQFAYSTAKTQSINLAEMLSEFWQEEKPILAKKRHVEQFNADVDAIKSDVARFEKRLQKLSARYTTPSPLMGEGRGEGEKA
jgi:ubiquinone biosynthesis accessory factor UbiJ